MCTIIQLILNILEIIYIYYFFGEVESQIKFWVNKQQELEILNDASSNRVLDLLESNNELHEQFVVLINELEQQVNDCVKKQQLIECVNDNLSNKNKLIELFEYKDTVEHQLIDLENKINIQDKSLNDNINELHEKHKLLFKSHDFINTSQKELSSKLINTKKYFNSEINKTNNLIYEQHKVMMNDININMSNLLNCIPNNGI